MLKKVGTFSVPSGKPRPYGEMTALSEMLNEMCRKSRHTVGAH